MKRGLHIAVDDARQRGADEGSLDAAATVRRSLVRRNVIAPVPRVTPAELAAWKVARMALAIGDMGDRFEEDEHVQAE